MKLQDAVVLVTGANRGLGRALVPALLEAGAARVYATARDPQKLAEVLAEHGERVVALALDITDERSVIAAAGRAPDVTVLVNNAGAISSDRLLTSTPAGIQAELTTNVLGPLAVTKAFLPALERAPEAAIVNVLSVASLANVPMFGVYSAAKAASYSLTLALRAALAATRIGVHAVLAGSIDTDMVKHVEMPKSSPAVVARGIVRGLEAGREDIAPDPMAEQLYAQWCTDPKAVERALAAMV